MSPIRQPRLLFAGLLGCLALANSHPPLPPDTSNQKPEEIQKITDTAGANALIRRQPGFFVPNLGQWKHPAQFVHRSGPMTLFLEDRGWIVDLVERPAAEPDSRSQAWGPAMRQDRDAEHKQRKVRGVALQMNFEGDPYVPTIVGEKPLEGHHNYFLGNDESCWRTHVPLYTSVRYEGLYPGIDVRLREANGVPEYDLLLQPGANLSLVRVHVDGGQGLSIAKDGSLVIQTELGPMTQPKPKTWTVDAYGRKHEVACHFTLLDADRFGFTAPGWDGGQSLTIDPGLIWSTFLGGRSNDAVYDISVDARGVVTVAGTTQDRGFPPTTGAYDTTFNNGLFDAFVSRLDPRRSGTAQLVYSTFLGGNGDERGTALHVNASGVVTVAGGTNSTNFPMQNAFDATHNGQRDAYVIRLDPSKNGPKQLVYSTYLGGTLDEHFNAISVNASGVMTMAGTTWSSGFPTQNAFDSSYNGNTTARGGDAFVSRLDPSKSPQLVYSTFLGGADDEQANGMSVDASGVVTVAGFTFDTSSAATNLPTTPGAYKTTHNGGGDGFVSRLDPSKPQNNQLVYSTFLGGSADEVIQGLCVTANGQVVVTGWTGSKDFPTSGNAYNKIYNGPIITTPGGDAFVTRLIPRNNLGKAGLLYSTFLGGTSNDYGRSVFVDTNGVLTVSGTTGSQSFPTTNGAHDTTLGGLHDVFVSRLDPSKTKQLVYSTFLGGDTAGTSDLNSALSVDASGVVTVAGFSDSPTFPTRGAFDSSYNGASVPRQGDPVGDAFISRLDMGVALYGDAHEISIGSGGTQKLTVNAGAAHANRLYWIFGSVTGTSPGVTLASAAGSVTIPLNPDIWTDLTIALANGAVLTRTKGTLSTAGTATASFNIPKVNLPSAIGLVFHHAYLVHDSKNNFYMASNPVPLKLVK